MQHGVPTRFFAAAAAVVVVLAVLIAPARAADDDTQAKARAFIEGLADQAVQALTNASVPREEREKRARVLLRENFAVPTIAQWVLGRYWRVATPAEQQEYLNLFEDLIVVTYVDRFTRYSGERLRVTRSVGMGETGDVNVFSDITNPGGSPIDIGWRVRTRDGSMKVVDVSVEGVSMGQTQRSEFASIIQNNGGQVSGLIAEMRRRLQQAS
ncbi:MAG: ABC transporter substrate-binding protein [Defluviicoccus sp.]|nr:ABC transporter substrate-binding protein [Defluviicoccus sp.]MDG4593012.1 ABC transporter substrate-binding protein [Defluviicoccus sp.]MDS4011960.1 ABC transporter substrate-binding protein [Defluviicoccus sp.]MDS4071819.1 ABC transporter substrate-binding protein [Defluviicoccus sp.]